MPESIATVNGYMAAFYAGDLERARAYTAPQFRFQGPFVETSDQRAFFESAAPLAALVRGFEVLRQWNDGSEVCTIFQLRLGSGSITMCEWHTVAEGLLASGRALFDTAAFRMLVPPAR